MVNWNDTAQKQLLLTVIHLQGTTATSWDKVAAMMGGGYTASAVKQQFNKLKRECRETFGEMGEGDGEAATPKPRGKGKKAAGEASTGKRKNRKDSEQAVGSEDDAEESPSKKVKVKAEAKDEVKDSDDEV